MIEGLRIHKEVLRNETESDAIILRHLSSGKPTLIGRFGGTEARALGVYRDIFQVKHLYDPFATAYSLSSLSKRMRQLRDLSGVYPANFETLKAFAKEYEGCILNSDVIGCWGETFTWVENGAIRKSSAEVVPHHATVPWVDNYPIYSKSVKPWSSFLEGMKVLIISPFAKSFESQFEIIDKVFANTSYPKFEAIFMTCTQSLGGLSDGRDWNYHLHSMKDRMAQVDFDIALVSAGSYAYPLANFAKTLGKVGVHTGGELQLFFGVYGSRWEGGEKLERYGNSFWVRPSNSERPANWTSVENGCYW